MPSRKCTGHSISEIFTLKSCFQTRVKSQGSICESEEHETQTFPQFHYIEYPLSKKLLYSLNQWSKSEILLKLANFTLFPLYFSFNSPSLSTSTLLLRCEFPANIFPRCCIPLYHEIRNQNKRECYFLYSVWNHRP